MRIDAEALDGERIQSDVVVIGAGPAGISIALEFSRHGHEVALIESGSGRFSREVQDLGDAASLDESRHAPMNECSRRQIGGASVIWGGRCVPYDPIDFEDRPYIPHSSWPVRFEELAAYFERTCDYFRCGRPVFNLHEIEDVDQCSIVPGLPDGDVLSSDLERWSLPTNFGHEYRQELENSSLIRIFTSLTCVEITLDPAGGRVEEVRCKTSRGRKNIDIRARIYIVACGGVDTTRLLLESNRVQRMGIGGESGKLGRFYMGHISGRIARVQFSTPPKQTIYGFDRDLDGTYLRRRFSFSAEFQRKKALANTIGFITNPEIADPGHHNGVLSFAYLALSSPLGRFFVADAIRKANLESKSGGRPSEHMRNMLFDLGRTLSFIPSFTYSRFMARRKVPGFSQYSASNSYPLHYHGEQIPNPNSRIELSAERDVLGMRRVAIDFQYAQEDIDSILQAHQCWDEYLRQHGVGQLEYFQDDPARDAWDQAKDGFHQVGTTRMSEQPADGVVDANCKVHGVDNLFLASSSNFVTSGQANSTFMIVAFALRTADHIRGKNLLR